MAMKTNKIAKENKGKKHNSKSEFQVPLVKASRKLCKNENEEIETKTVKEEDVLEAYDPKRIKVDEAMISDDNSKDNSVVFLADQVLKRNDEFIKSMEELEAENQIFSPVPRFNPDDDFETYKTAILAYKKDVKNFFAGDLLKACDRKGRDLNDNWYFWNPEFLRNIDSNEEIRNRILNEKGHKAVSDILEKGCVFIQENTVGSSADPLFYWNYSIKDKVKSLRKGLNSVKKLIKSENGMKTLWGRIKYKGFFKNSARQFFSLNENKFGRNLDLIDYVKYKEAEWDEAYSNLKEKNVFKKFATE